MERKMHVWKVFWVDGDLGELRVYWDPGAEDAAAEVSRCAEIENQRQVASVEYVGAA